MNKYIELIVLSGFFGAGKTTFLHHILTQYPEKKIGVIVNEFGSFHIDEDLIRRDEVRVEALNHGSVFCSCLMEYFKEAIVSFSHTNVDYLIVESSGMADPSNMESILYEVKDFCKRDIRYKGVVCIVDGQDFENDVRGFEVIKRQIRCSNFIVVNKADELDDNQKLMVEEMVQEINGKARTFFTEYGKIPFNLLEKYLSYNSRKAETINTRDIAPEVYSLDADGVQKLEKILEFINRIKDYTVRIKGFVTTQKQVYFIEGIEGRVIVKESDLETKDNTRIVMIGYDGTDFYDETREIWEKVVGTEYCLYD